MWLRQILKTISAYRKVKIRDGEGEDRREREGGERGKDRGKVKVDLHMFVLLVLFNKWLKK